jgi:hypothetical protein
VAIIATYTHDGCTPEMHQTCALVFHGNCSMSSAGPDTVWPLLRLSNMNTGVAARSVAVMKEQCTGLLVQCTTAVRAGCNNRDLQAQTVVRQKSQPCALVFHGNCSLQIYLT